MIIAQRTLLAAGLFFMGLLAAVSSMTMVTGMEELAHWDTVTISNKNAMYFMQPALIAALGGIYANKYPRWRWVFLAGGVGLAVAVAWWRSTFNIMGLF